MICIDPLNFSKKLDASSSVVKILKQKKDGMIFHPFLYRNKFLFLGGQCLTFLTF